MRTTDAHSGTSDAPTLSIGRAYSASESARILGLSESAFNARVRRKEILPVTLSGDRRFSGYSLAQLLGWPLSDDPRDYAPS